MILCALTNLFDRGLRLAKKLRARSSLVYRQTDHHLGAFPDHIIVGCKRKLVPLQNRDILDIVVVITQFAHLFLVEPSHHVRQLHQSQVLLQFLRVLEHIRINGTNRRDHGIRRWWVGNNRRIRLWSRSQELRKAAYGLDGSCITEEPGKVSILEVKNRGKRHTGQEEAAVLGSLKS